MEYAVFILCAFIWTIIVTILFIRYAYLGMRDIKRGYDTTNNQLEQQEKEANL